MATVDGIEKILEFLFTGVAWLTGKPEWSLNVSEPDESRQLARAMRGELQELGIHIPPGLYNHSVFASTFGNAIVQRVNYFRSAEYKATHARERQQPMPPSPLDPQPMAAPPADVPPVEVTPDGVPVAVPPSQDARQRGPQAGSPEAVIAMLGAGTA